MYLCSGWEALTSYCCVPGSKLGKHRESDRLLSFERKIVDGNPERWGNPAAQLIDQPLSIILSVADQSGSGDMLMICLVWARTQQRNIIPAFDLPTLSVMSPIWSVGSASVHMSKLQITEQAYVQIHHNWLDDHTCRTSGCSGNATAGAAARHDWQGFPAR